MRRAVKILFVLGFFPARSIDVNHISNSTGYFERSHMVALRNPLTTTSRPSNNNFGGGGYFHEDTDDYDNNIGNEVMDVYSRQDVHGTSNDGPLLNYLEDIGPLPSKIPFLPGVPRKIPYVEEYGRIIFPEGGDYDEGEEEFYPSQYPTTSLIPPLRPGFPFRGAPGRGVYRGQKNKYSEDEDNNGAHRGRYEYEDFEESERDPSSFRVERPRFRSPAPSENQLGFFDYFNNEDVYVTTPRFNLEQIFRTGNERPGFKRTRDINGGFQYPIYRETSDGSHAEPYGTYIHRLYKENAKNQH